MEISNRLIEESPLKKTAMEEVSIERHEPSH